MTKVVNINSIRFMILVLVQAIICNHINFLGFINPYIYIIFLLLYPINNNRQLFLVISFVLGLSIDVFSDTAGVHATASLCIAYVRPIVLKLVYRVQYEHQNMRLYALGSWLLIYYIMVITILHHFVLFTLEIFSLNNILLISKKALLSSIFTILLSTVLIFLFRRSKV